MACRGKDWVDPMDLRWSGKKTGEKKKTDNIDKTVKSLESVAGSVKAIVVHCGINDIRTKDPKDASKAMVKSLKGILKDRPNLTVIVSKIPPVKDPNLQAKRDLSNALVCSELVENPDVSFVAHENLHFASLKDTIHPNMKGSSIIARNLGSHIHTLFWERPRKATGVIFSNRINYILSNVEIRWMAKL